MQQSNHARANVQLFGGPTLLKDGRALQLSPTQASLLAIAYASGQQGISRPEAAWLLWEEGDTQAARHRLSQLLYGIRRRAGFPCVDEGASDCLKGTLSSDFADFQRRVRERDLTALKACAEKEFLSDLVPPTASFSHWVDGRRASLRKSARELGAAELAAAEAAGDWKRVCLAAELLLELDPGDEGMLRRLLQARALSGSRVELDAALRSYGERQRALTGERWTPERATLSLVGRIEHAARNSLHRSATPIPALVGRGPQLQRLHAALSTRSPAVQFTVVAGEAGIGKTRLIREALTRLRLEGFTVLESGASQLQRDLPLHSLLGALSDRRVLDCLQELEEPWKSSLTVLLPHLSPDASVTPPALDPQATSRRLMEALYQLMRRVVTNGPTVVFLDDLQWLDKTTLCAIEFLTERTPRLAITVVFGLRSEAEQDHTLRSFLDVARRSGTWIELDELDQKSADQLLAEASPRPLSAPELSRLSRVAGRSPFFLIELVNDYCKQASTPRPHDPAEHVPSSIRQLIANRLEALSREGRTLLQLLSVAGQMRVDAPVPMEELPAAHLPDIADDLLRARLIQHEAGTISIRHDLIRQTAYELMGPIKKAVLHRRVAQALLDRAGETAHGEAAIHFDRAGDRSKAFGCATQAAILAQSNGAVPEAIFFWQTAQRNASTADEVSTTNERLAELLYEARRLAEAIPLLEAAATHCDDEVRARYALYRLDALSELPGAEQEKCLREVEHIARVAVSVQAWTQYAEAVEVRLRILDRLHRVEDIRTQLTELREVALKGGMESPYTRCLMHSILALSSFYHDDDEGLSDASRALELAREHAIPRLLLRAYHRKVFCYALRGRLHTEEAARVSEAALAWAAQSGDLRSKATIYNTVGCYHLDTGDLGRAEKFFREAETLVCGPSERALVFGNLGELSYCRGEIEQAEIYFRKAAAEADRQPVSGFISVGVLAGLGLCALESGKLAAAQAAESRVRRALSGPWVHDPYLVVRFLAELDRRRGRIRDAVQLLHDRARLEERRPIYWIRTKTLEARYLRLIDPEAAEKLSIIVEKKAQDLGLPQIVRR